MIDKRNINDKIFWITGASSGIGEQLLYSLNEKGARVIISARQEDQLIRIKNNCRNPDMVVAVPLDLLKHDTLFEIANEALSIWGTIDTLIHNAGVVCKDLVTNIPSALDKKIMDINYFGPLILTKEILPSMIRKGSGQFVITGSLSSKFGVPTLSAYAAAKHALLGFFESMRAEVFKQGIKITVAIPGFVQTAFTQKALKGDGTLYCKRDLSFYKGISAEICAHKIVKAIEKEKEEVWIGGSEILSLYLQRFFPRLFSKVIRNRPLRAIENLKQKLNL